MTLSDPRGIPRTRCCGRNLAAACPFFVSRPGLVIEATHEKERQYGMAQKAGESAEPGTGYPPRPHAAKRRPEGNVPEEAARPDPPHDRGSQCAYQDHPDHKHGQGKAQLQSTAVGRDIPLAREVYREIPQAQQTDGRLVRQTGG